MASVTTRDHDEIQQWASEHGATPSVVSDTGGMLRFEFAPQPPEELAEVEWSDFFRVFDERGLELVYDDKPGSRFHKLIYPETAAARVRGTGKAAQPVRDRKRAQIQSIKSKTRAAGGRGARAGSKTGSGLGAKSGSKSGSKTGSRAGKVAGGKSASRRPARKAA
ncbi:MAG: hypothetical protein ACRD1A_12920 [Terriglobales bacterium]